ncbi:unnamed protein product [Acanthosepion pharaonis]|uniref:Uncharacterized protein n=1 Tax=Acanthosepion pharaonis TaxID=158019 RepID=A0A812BP91_ACAPH|nr:unnamed protein product [Sepia pharaonis]
MSDRSAGLSVSLVVTFSCSFFYLSTYLSTYLSQHFFFPDEKKRSTIFSPSLFTFSTFLSFFSFRLLTSLRSSCHCIKHYSSASCSLYLAVYLSISSDFPKETKSLHLRIKSKSLFLHIYADLLRMARDTELFFSISLSFSPYLSFPFCPFTYISHLLTFFFIYCKFLLSSFSIFSSVFLSLSVLSFFLFFFFHVEL